MALCPELVLALQAPATLLEGCPRRKPRSQPPGALLVADPAQSTMTCGLSRRRLALLVLLLGVLLVLDVWRPVGDASGHESIAQAASFWGPQCAECQAARDVPPRPAGSAWSSRARPARCACT